MSIETASSILRTLGQLECGLCNQSGPCHHCVDAFSSVGSIPRDKRSAGLSLVGIYRHSHDFVLLWIDDTLFPTKVFNSEDDFFIQCNTIIESVQRTVSTVGNRNASLTRWTNFPNSFAAQSSRRGTLIACTGATRDFDATK